jgi:YidC/Oxa1 family membrane protein insertase
MDKKTILAVILAAMILFGYQFYMAKLYPDAYIDSGRDTKSKAEVQERIMPEYTSLDEGEEEFFANEVEPALPLQEINVETEKYIVTLSNEGGCIKGIILKEYPDPRTGEMYKFIDIEKTEEGIFNMDGLGILNLPKVRFATTEEPGEITFSTRLNSGLKITKRYFFPNSFYNMQLEVYLENTTNQPFLTDYRIASASNITIETRLDRTYTHTVSEINGKPLRSRGGRKGEGTFTKGHVAYAGLQTRHFSVIAKPSAPTKGSRFRQIGDNQLTEIEIEQFSIPSMSGIRHNYLLFVGPTNKDLLAQHDLESALSYGMWGGISKVLLAGLNLFHRIFRNWGIAVILIAACVNLLLYPLTRKSFESMKKMQELQPQIDQLKGAQKDSPQKANKEMMELFKKNKVNPMGGCLILFLQLPIIVAFWQTLMRSMNLRGANFLWIKDLSSPEALPIPFDLPILGNTINILPILMTGAMIFQQRVSMAKTAAANPQQKQQQQMMMIMIPAMFLLFMYHAPSGLVLYWLTNTLLTMFEQRAIMRG